MQLQGRFKITIVVLYGTVELGTGAATKDPVYWIRSVYWWRDEATCGRPAGGAFFAI